jgi:hypothetical protein
MRYGAVKQASHLAPFGKGSETIIDGESSDLSVFHIVSVC